MDFSIFFFYSIVMGNVRDTHNDHDDYASSYCPLYYRSRIKKVTEYYQKNKHIICSKINKKRAENRDQYNAYHRQWRKNNPNKVARYFKKHAEKKRYFS